MRYVADQISQLPLEDETVRRQVQANQQINEQRQRALDVELAQAETEEDMQAIAEIAGLHEQAMEQVNAELRNDYQAASVAGIVTEDRLQRSLEEALCPGPRPIRRYRWFGKITDWACGSEMRQARLQGRT